MSKGLALLVSTLVCAGGLARAADIEVPAGTRFMVELRDKLDAKKVKRGKKFEARTLEALRAADGSLIPAGAKLKGRVSSAENDRLMLRFEQIETKRGKAPIIVSVVRVPDEKETDSTVGPEGEIRARSTRGRDAAIGAAVLGGLGAAVGASQAGGKGAAIGAGAGAATGAVLGAAAGSSKDLVLYQGTRLELALDRALLVARR